ncbi:MAG: hypothetical protein V4858_05155 [Pseudomonadota bacterium]
MGIHTLVDDSIRLKSLEAGRRMVNLCLFAWVAATAFQILQTRASTLFIAGAFITSAVGVLRLAEGFKCSGPTKIACVVAMFVPVVNLFVMNWFSTRATQELRIAGYSVGIFQASKEQKPELLHTDAPTNSRN